MTHGHLKPEDSLLDESTVFDMDSFDNAVHVRRDDAQAFQDVQNSVQVRLVFKS